MNFGFIKEVAMKKERLVVGLDVGTTKTCAVVGEVSPLKSHGGGGGSSDGAWDRGISVIGIGTAASKGIRKGVVTNIESTVESIREAVEEAETAAGVEIKAVHIGVTGNHIGFLSSNGVIAVKGKVIGQNEVDSVIEAARAVAIPFDREMLHVIPLGYKVNGENGITDPRGMAGVRLETDVQIITGAATLIHNLMRSCKIAGLEVIDVVFQPLASADAVLTQDEKELGVAVIDIGGGTTELALFRDGNICHSAVLAVGGNNFTNDIAIGLRVPSQEAENIKRKHGCAMMSRVKEDEYIEIRHTDGKINRRVPRRYLVEILQPRAEELLGLVKKEIIGEGFHRNMNSGVVLAGGAVLMEGLDVMAENILELPVRIGEPVGISGITEKIYSPSYATGIGLMLYGAEESFAEHGFNNGNILNGFKTRMRGWIGEIFK